MANALITPTVIAKRALMNLDNNLVMGNLVYRDYDSEFGPTKIGDTVTIRRPNDFTVTDGATLSIQDHTEGSLTMQISKRKHISFVFSDSDLTMTVDDFDKRYIKPAAIQLANQIDVDLMTAAYQATNNWVGTPGQTINSHADFLKAVERLDVLAVPQGDRAAVLSPNDHHGLAGNFSGIYIQGVAGDALKQGKLPMIGGVDPYMTQNVAAHTVGAHGGTPLVRGAAQNVTYASVKTTMTQTFQTDGWTVDSGLKAGDVFTIAGVYDVNPVTKATLPHLKQFVITTDVTTTNPNTNATVLTIYPAIISSGAYQNVSAAPADNAAITYVGTASTIYPQNLVFHRNAYALAMVPIAQAPSGAGVSQSTERYKGLSLQWSAQYDITNARMIYRLDAMYGVKAIDPRLGVRASGTS
jgi:hypothetical protein